jgi:acetyl esterase/lipase
MTLMRNRFAFVAVALASAAALSAQIDRYELGLRLRAFERRLDATTDAERRSQAYGELDKAVQAFFRMDTTTVAKCIGAADRALGAPATPAHRFVERLQLVCDARLADPSAGPVALRLVDAFGGAAELPAELVLTVRLDGDAKDRLRAPITQLPLVVALPVSDAARGDRTLTWMVHARDEVLATRAQGLSLASDLGKRVAAVEAAAGERDRAPGSLEAGTLDLLAGFVAGMTRARPEETVLPGAALLAEAEALASAVAADKPLYGPATVGQRWLRVPTGKSTTVVRLQAPPAPATGGKQPLVLALHGAGGSENLFFDGYGDGAVVTLAAARGWFLAAPRLGMLGGGADLPAIVDALAARFPIDPTRVVVVGHSMGAGAAMSAAGRAPTRYRAVAALGGGGGVPKNAAARELPFFVGIGERDFARGGALGLHEGLRAAGIPSTLREYPAVEHLAIVQIALPDVFAFFDATLAAK